MWDELIASPVWHELVGFITRWYAEPISANWGHSEAEVAEAESRLGARLPQRVREWFLLVGRRLRPVQDTPATLDSLSIEDGLVRLWTENQGVWSIHTGLGDPAGSVVTGDYASSLSGFTLPDVLLGMVVSETLMAEAGPGLFGEPTADATGGYLEDVTADMAASIRSFQPLPWPDCPHFSEPLRGDRDTVLRLDPADFCWWITRTAEAHESLMSTLGIDPHT